VRVERFEDGTAPRQVDALIRYPDRLAALEIVTDPDKAFHRQQAALHRNKTIEVEGLRESWMVSVSRRDTFNEVQVKQELPELLLALQDNLPLRPPPWDVKPSMRDRLGIKSVWSMADSNVPGRVWLTLEPWAGWEGDERTVGEWVTRVLVEKAPDVPRKLRDHPDVSERHAFIWAIPSSDMEVQAQLRPGDDDPFPVTPPTLPEAGVTHVWVGGLGVVPGRSGMVPGPGLVAHSVDAAIGGSGDLADWTTRVLGSDDAVHWGSLSGNSGHAARFSRPPSCPDRG
jgi:hypothetical protein